VQFVRTGKATCHTLKAAVGTLVVLLGFRNDFDRHVPYGHGDHWGHEFNERRSSDTYRPHTSNIGIRALFSADDSTRSSCDRSSCAYLLEKVSMIRC
jgi:hypothetical protein